MKARRKPTNRSHIGWVRVVLEYPCDTCGAAPGEYCRTYSGVPKYEPHVDRSRIASEHHWKAPDDGE